MNLVFSVCLFVTHTHTHAFTRIHPFILVGHHSLSLSFSLPAHLFVIAICACADCFDTCSHSALSIYLVAVLGSPFVGLLNYTCSLYLNSLAVSCLGKTHPVLSCLSCPVSPLSAWCSAACEAEECSPYLIYPLLCSGPAPGNISVSFSQIGTQESFVTFQYCVISPDCLCYLN